MDYQYSLLRNILPSNYNLSACASLLSRHSIYPTQASLLVLLTTFVNNFHFNLITMFVYFVNQSSVINFQETHFIIIGIILSVVIPSVKALNILAQKYKNVVRPSRTNSIKKVGEVKHSLTR